MKVELRVNGQTRPVDVEPRKSLLDCLREDLRLAGTHAGCEHGVCGACTVLLDGEAVRSCLIFAVQADGYEITTIEGVAPGPGELGIIQDAFCETHGLQCGYCTPGMILTAQALLERNASPTRHEIVDAISGNICRCTGYGQIIEAVELAAERMRGRNTPDPSPEGRASRAGGANRGGDRPAGISPTPARAARGSALPSGEGTGGTVQPAEPGLPAGTRP